MNKIYLEILENAGFAAYHRDLATDTYGYLSPAVFKILGYTAEEMKRMPIAEVVGRMHPDDIPGVKLVMSESADHPRVPYAAYYRFRKKDETWCWVADTTTVLTNTAESPVARIGSLSDITAVRRAEEKFSKAFQTSPYAIVITRSKDGQIIEVNDAFVSITGFTQAEAVGDSSINLNLWSNIEDRDSVLLALKNGKTVKDREFQFKVKNGRHITGLFSSQIIHIADEPFILSSIADVTERKQAEILIQTQQEQLVAQNEELVTQGSILLTVEDELRRLNLELEKKVKDRTEELQTANAALAVAAKLKDEFLASMSHELRTPLTGVLGLAESLEIGIYGDVTPAQAKALQRLRDSGEHLLALITDILDLSKIGAGKLELNKEMLSIGELCDASLQMIKYSADSKNLKVTYTRDERAEEMCGDSRRLKQILVNLLSNAVKFTHKDGKIGLDVSCLPGALNFTVWDTGIGMSPADMQNLFKPFTQIDSSLSRQYAGTGLGLALVNNLATLHGGQVAVLSSLGEGSRFSVVLPWRGSESSGDRTLSRDYTIPLIETHAAAFPGTKVLVVDDSDVFTVLLQDFLVANGFFVSIARSGEECLRKVRQELPDVVLMDIQMPGMSGVGAVKAIKADADVRAARVPIIAMTSVTTPNDPEKLQAIGLAMSIAKPINLNLLVTSINEVLSSKSS